MEKTLYEDLSNNTQMTEPGQYDLDLCMLVSKGGNIDLREMVKSMNFYESIYNTFITGEITCVDDKNILTGAKISGTEPIIIKFTTKGSGFPITLNLMVAKIKDKEKIKEAVQRYTLVVVHPDSIADTRRKISQSFQGKYSDMVESIFQNHLESTEDIWIQSTQQNNRIVIPNESPVKAINMIAAYSKSKDADNASFLFYQTSKSYHFRSFDDMIYSDLVTPQGLNGGSLEFTIDRETIDPDVHVTQKALRAESFELINDVDVSKHTEIGSYGSSLLVHDIHNKSYDVSTFNYHRQFDTDSNANVVMLESEPITPLGPIDPQDRGISDFPNAEFNLVSTAGSKQYTEDQFLGTFQALNYKGTVLQRRSELAASGLLRAKMVIGGMSGIQASDIISIKMFIQDATTSISGSKPIKDKKLSGKWIVESVQHSLSDKYSCILHIIRDKSPDVQPEYTKLQYNTEVGEVLLDKTNNRKFVKRVKK